MGFGIHRVARSGKAGMFRRGPDVQELADRLARIARRMEKAAVARAKWKQDRFVVELELHAMAPRAKLAVEPDATLSLKAVTSPIGPGYHLEVLRRVEPILAELDYAWEADDDDDDDESPAGVQRDMCEWLADELRGGAARIDVKRPYVVDAPVLTMMGPRDASWRDAVVADPARAADAFAYWQPRAPGHAARARALLAMWHEVPWREPIDDAERAVMTRVDNDLRAARRADIELELPWVEWAELHDLLGIDDGFAEESHRRAGNSPCTIGYRRHALDVELSGGWSVRLGGGFVGRWEEDGARYWATDGDRVIEFTSLTAREELDSDHLLAVAPERHPVIAQLSDGARRGRAEAYDDGDIHVVHGLVTSAPHVAILTCKCAAADEPWALATWRSLTQGKGD